jgi:hypothetical protein
MEHTPEPWELDRSGKYFSKPVIRHNGRVIAILPDNGVAIGEPWQSRAREEDAANAVLLLKAPKLLKGLTNLLAADLALRSQYGLQSAIANNVRQLIAEVEAKDVATGQ